MPADPYNDNAEKRAEYIKMVKEFCAEQNLQPYEVFEGIKLLQSPDEGVSEEQLAQLQMSQQETKSPPVIRPADLDGVSNDPVKDAGWLTVELAELKRRFNNLIMAHYDGKF